MPLYIRDDKVDDLAVRFMKLTGAKSKTEAVRNALVAQLETVSNQKPLLARLEPLLQRADSVGAVDRGFNMKEFTDELWGDA
jgi:antitoxin VapB